MVIVFSSVGLLLGGEVLSTFIKMGHHPTTVSGVREAVDSATSGVRKNKVLLLGLQ